LILNSLQKKNEMNLLKYTTLRKEGKERGGEEKIRREPVERHYSTPPPPLQVFEPTNFFDQSKSMFFILYIYMGINAEKIAASRS
jgi:hypothetical protein